MAINAPNAATECLYSEVRNISPAEKFFGFLPPHGRRLACGEALSFWGDIQSWLYRNTPNERGRRSFEEAIAGATPVMTLVKTPSVHLFDSTLHETQIITLANAVFVAADPCWGAYSSSAEIVCD
jgi:hypothetical protein